MRKKRLKSVLKLKGNVDNAHNILKGVHELEGKVDNARKNVLKGIRKLKGKVDDTRENILNLEGVRKLEGINIAKTVQRPIKLVINTRQFQRIRTTYNVTGFKFIL